MHKFISSIIALTSIIFYSSADDILFTNGSVEDVKIKEITPSEIKYIKTSRPDGPMYTVPKSDVVSISYEDGSIDKFNAPINYESLGNINSDAVAFNIAEKKKYEGDIHYIGKETAKEARACYGLCRFDDESVLYDGNILIEFISGADVKVRHPSWNEHDQSNPYVFYSAIKIRLSNLSNQPIYIDLANTFFKRGTSASPYYVPSSSTNINSETGSVGINLGGITGALGIGGSIGSLASGINIGSSTTSGTATTIYSQRIVSIPPQSSIELSPQLLFPPYLLPGAYKVATKHYGYNFNAWQLVGLDKKDIPVNIGMTKDYNAETSPISFGLYLSYSFNEQLSEIKTINNTAYLTRLIGLENFKPATTGKMQTKKVKNLSKDFSKPFHFYVFIH